MTRVIAAVVLAGAVASAQASLLQRPTGVSAVLQNSPKLYDGSYAGTGVSRMCGEVDPSQSFAPARSFLVEYPLDASNDATITDVRFNSKALVGGITETQTFYVSITVKRGTGRPPAYVVDTERTPASGSGKAVLKVTNGVAELRVTAQDPLGAELQLIVTCRPSAP